MRARQVWAGVAAVGLAAGLGLVGTAPASAADLGNFSINCALGQSYNNGGPISGQVGDTFTVTPSGATCYVSGGGGVVTGPSAFFGTTGTFRLASAGYVDLIIRGGVSAPADGYGGRFFAVTVSSPAPTPDPETSASPIPAWVQAYGRFGADATCADGWDASWQSWAEPITGGWVCTRSIPSLG